MTRSAVALVTCMLAPAAFPADAPLTNHDVVEMERANISTDLIIATIENAAAVRFDVRPTTIIDLKRSGMDERVITAMVRAAKPSSDTARGSPSKPLASGSYEDGYQMGLMYGKQVRGSYHPGDIIMPGVLVNQMTVKLGAVEYQKWEEGYLRGHEDGRRGRQRSSLDTEASDESSSRSREPSAVTRTAIKAAQSRYPDAPIFAVFHAHGPVRLAGCEGYLTLRSGRLIYEVTASVGAELHAFDSPKDEIQEIKRNRFTQLFHIKLIDGRNLNFLSPDLPPDGIVQQLLTGPR